MRPTARGCSRRGSRLRRRLRGDGGTSLVELMVGMMLMSIFLAMFTGAVVMMNSAMNRSQAVNLSASQLNVAFLNLDSMVRYAAFISTPSRGPVQPDGVSRDWYVELRVTNTGTEVCNQLRVDIPSQQLQRRTWTVVNGTASTPGLWVPIASGILTGGAVSGAKTAPQPFTLVPPVGNAAFQQLTVSLISPAGPASAPTNSMSTFTLTALNSPIGAAPAGAAQICQQWGQP